MKKLVLFFLCALLCVLPLAGCAGNTEKDVAAQVELSLEQLGKPRGEAYKALGLPGDPKDAFEPTYPYLIARDSVKMLNITFLTVITHHNSSSDEDEEPPRMHHAGEPTPEPNLTYITDGVGYHATLKSDGKELETAMRFYDVLCKAYGTPTAVEGRLSFEDANAETLAAAAKTDSPYCVSNWKIDDREIALSYRIDSEGSSLSLTVDIPHPPKMDEDGNLLRDEDGNLVFD